MKNILTVLLVYMLSISAYASEYVDVVIVNYNFFSKMYGKHEYAKPNALNASFSQPYSVNFFSGSLSAGKYIADDILITVEGSLGSEYSSNSKLPSDSSIKVIDYSKMSNAALLTNVYYNFSYDDDINYYASIGCGIGRIYSLNNKAHSFPYMWQFRVGIKYSKFMFGIPYVDYKYTHIQSNANKQHFMEFTSHNLECGIAILI